MRLFKKGMLVTAVALVMGLALNHQVQAQAGLEGTVVDDSTNKALADVEVRIEMLDLSATTDSDGNFTFEQLEPGTHNISVSAEGYEHWSREVEIIDELKDLDIRLKKKQEQQEAIRSSR